MQIYKWVVVFLNYSATVPQVTETFDPTTQAEERRPRPMTTEQEADRSRWLALYVLCGAMLMIVLDATIVHVALPSIKESLDFSQSDLTWVINASLIPF